MIRVLLISALAVLVGTGGGYAYGRHVGGAAVQTRWDAAAAMQAAVLNAATAQMAATKTQVVTHYVDRVRVVHERAATIIKKVPVYVTDQADARCIVPRGFVRVHNAAAQGDALPQPAASIVGAPSGVALSTVARVVGSNYTSCHTTAARLIALQSWAQQVSQAAP